MKTITDTTTPNYAAILTAKRAELLRAAGRNDGIEVQRFADPVDNVIGMIERERSARDKSRSDGLLRQVEAALERIRTDGYGTCLDCSEPIPEKRLAAVPWASRCVVCEGAREWTAADPMTTVSEGVE